MTSGDKIYPGQQWRSRHGRDGRQTKSHRPFGQQKCATTASRKTSLQVAIEDEDFGDNDTAYLYESVWL